MDVYRRCETTELMEPQLLNTTDLLKAAVVELLLCGHQYHYVSSYKPEIIICLRHERPGKTHC